MKKINGKKIRLIPLEEFAKNATKKFDELITPGQMELSGWAIPDCCKGCANHPTNGGSGICSCTAPYMCYPYYGEPYINAINSEVE